VRGVRRYARRQVTTGRVIAKKYRLGRELGRGGMGSVWAAEHIALGTRVAIKLIDRTQPSTDLRRRFEQEARAAAAIRSPHAVQVFDYGVDGATPYLVIELLEGQSLAQRLADEITLTRADTWSLVCHVVHAINRAHALGFVHRDLKPDNIFFVTTATHPLVKVLDFGVAKALAGPNVILTRAGALMGTPAYASPEQVNGAPVDARSDLWSIGVIVFECLTGLLAFNRPNLQMLLAAICREPVVVPSDVADVPQGFDAWFARALERAPEQRFQSAHELRDALQPIIGPGSPRASVGPLDRVEPPRAPPTSTLHVPTYTAPPATSSGPRFPSAIPAGIDGKRDLRHAAILRDTTPRGATLLTRTPFRVGQSLVLSLHFESPEHGAPVAAEVTSVEARDESVWRFRVSVRFSEPLSDELLERLDSKARGGARHVTAEGR